MTREHRPDQIDIAFITASDMPIPDQETHLIVDAVEGMGSRAGDKTRCIH